MFLRNLLILFISLCNTFVVAQGNFFNEGLVFVEYGAVLKVAGDLHLAHSIQGRGEVQFVDSQLQHIYGDSADFHFLSIQKLSNKVQTTFQVRIDSAFHFSQGNYEQLKDTLILKNNAVFSGGNNTSYLITKEGIIQVYVDVIDKWLPLGSSFFHPISIKEKGLADTFYVRTTNQLFADGVWNSSMVLQNHVGLLSWEIFDKNEGGNNLDILFQWDDAQNAFDFVEQFATPIYYDTLSDSFVNLLPCPVDVSNINPNLLSVTGIAAVGMFGVGDSLYLNDLHTLQISPSPISSFCTGDSILLEIVPTLLVVWNDSLVNNHVWAKNAGMYYATYTNANGCVFYSDTVHVQVLPLPTPIITQSANNILTTGFFDSYQWYLDGILVNGANAATLNIDANGVYMVVVSNEDGCTGYAMLEIQNIGLNNVLENTIVLGPNPAKGNSWIKIDVPQEEQEVLLCIADATGKVIEEKQIHLFLGTNFIELQLPSMGVFIVTLMFNSAEKVTYKWINIE